MKRQAKKILILALVPLLMATQCEDDFDNSGFETTYLIQNDSNTDLFLLNEENTFVAIENQSNTSIGSSLNSTTNPIAPSEYFLFNSIKLYRTDNENFVLVYEQNPLDDTLWQLSEPVVNRFEYTLLIMEDVIE